MPIAQFRIRQTLDAIQFTPETAKEAMMWAQTFTSTHVDPATGGLEVLCGSHWVSVSFGDWVVHNPAMDVTMVWTDGSFDSTYERVI